MRERAGSALEPVSGASERRAHARNAGRSCHGQKVACWRVDVALRVHWGVTWRRVSHDSELFMAGMGLGNPPTAKETFAAAYRIDIEQHVPPILALTVGG